MSLNDLRGTVEAFVAETIALPQHLLESEAYNWDEYPGIRMVHLHTALALRDLAGRILVARQAAGRPLTRTQYALLDHRRAFRDMQVLLVGQPEALTDAIPAPEEWNLRSIVVHMHDVERYFYASINNALAGRDEHEPTEAEVAEWADEPEQLPADGELSGLLSDYEQLHWRIVERMAQLSDEETLRPSALWESAPRPILFRMERWAAHLREHTNQLEKSLRWLDAPPTESRMLARQTYAALAEVEGLCIGAEDVIEPLCAELAAELQSRYDAWRLALHRAESFVVAIQAGDLAEVQRLIGEVNDIAFTPLPDGMSPISYSYYRGNREIVAALTAANPYPNFFESATIGNVDRVQKHLTHFPENTNNYSRDGYTALQLACFFGHEEVVRLLLAQGGNPHAVSRNAMQIQPLHAAVAARSPKIVADLIAAGADVNARQQDDFTPMMAAIQNGDDEIVRLLKEAGAV